MSSASNAEVTGGNARRLPLVISIQSQVAFGHVGNSAAALPMRACGVDVVEVPTTLLSNHPHYPTMRGCILDADLVADILTGLLERDLGTRAAVILSGFMGQAETASAVAGFVRQVRAVNPRLVYACDPVMGDSDLGHFANAPLREAFRDELVPLADVILPNAFELQTLSGIQVTGPDAVSEARAVLDCPAVVATSVPVPSRPTRLATVTTTARGCASVEVDRLPVRPAGTGDLFAGLVAARIALGTELEAAVARAVAGVGVALSRTGTEPWAEMPITAALDAIVAAGGD
ncbi:pyridoxal kinase [Rhodobacteraceae bacterium 2CG4]|uniref:pyridoxal kinase n=1 Tax=Halovulum marinum TaxID=2662447 RepID=A0A6L5Z660_9RHOB|nr:pyridoxal kinase [Halovulum marinum]MSU91829.1 pyridoxal kinase [Halovulum marinum]